ncbi:MAG: hypothetical protein AB7T49_07605 [Oligoflexales bacterium]
MSEDTGIVGTLQDLIEVLQVQTKCLQSLITDLGQLHSHLGEDRDLALVASRLTELHIRMNKLRTFQPRPRLSASEEKAV